MQLLSKTTLVCFAALFLSFGVSSLEVKTKSGNVKGFTKTTSDGIELDYFLGIPYAAPPTGQNRFAPPKEAEPWSGTFDATVPPRPCYQIMDPKYRTSEFVSPLQETEDCLKLNIWAPKHRSPKSAVMVWIHGGGFATGSSDLSAYDGSLIAAHGDVIVVSMNYRLSGFGFLYLGHPLAPGNAGLMDQALALQWVRKNIEAFGGDPERVTVFGESAGGASVGLQLLVPSSLDLFKNAILQSGTGVNFWATFKPEKALANALVFAEMAGCPAREDRIQESVTCLQGLSAEKIHSLMVDFEDEPIKMIFKPVVDGKFLPGEPSELLSKGKYCGEKNVLIGYTKEDGSFLVPIKAPDMEVKDDSEYSEEQIRQLISRLTLSNQEIGGTQLDLVKYIYSDWDEPEDRISARGLMVHYLTDRWFACAAIHTANKMADKGNKVFFYRFDHVSGTHRAMPLPRWMGSSHGDELAFLFGHASKVPEERYSEDSKLSKQMIRYWSNFAKRSDPNDEYLPTWPRYDSKEKPILKFDGKATTVGSPGRQTECAFWEHIFPKTTQDSKNEL